MIRDIKIVRDLALGPYLGYIEIATCLGQEDYTTPPFPLLGVFDRVKLTEKIRTQAMQHPQWVEFPKGAEVKWEWATLRIDDTIEISQLVNAYQYIPTRRIVDVFMTVPICY
jgi:hypothetical protein